MWGDGVGEAFDDDAFGFEVGDAVVGTMSHEDGFGEELDEGARVFGEPAVVGLVVVDHEVVGGVTLGTVELVFEDAVEGAPINLRTGSEPERIAAILRFIYLSDYH